MNKPSLTPHIDAAKALAEKMRADLAEAVKDTGQRGASARFIVAMVEAYGLAQAAERERDTLGIFIDKALAGALANVIVSHVGTREGREVPLADLLEPALLFVDMVGARCITVITTDDKQRRTSNASYEVPNVGNA